MITPGRQIRRGHHVLAQHVQQPFYHQKITLIACGVNGQAKLIRKPPWNGRIVISTLQRIKIKAE